MLSEQAHADLLAQVGEIEGRSLWQDARRRLFRNRAAVVSMVVLSLITLAAIFAPWISPYAFDEINWDLIGAPPDLATAHWFGTDNNGRDLFVRVLYGARVSLAVGFAATLVSLLIGVVYGAASGFFGGRVDEAKSLFERLLTLTSDLGLLSEEYDPAARRQLGNFPQAFSHVALVNTALGLQRHELGKRPHRLS